MTSIIEKRLSLHRNMANQQEENNSLRTRMNQLQALANIGTVTCMIAHEINNLLTPLSTYSALALKNPKDKALAEKALQKTVQNCDQASKIMESMLAVTSGQGQKRQNVKLITLVEEVFGCLCRDFSRDGISVDIRIPEGLTVSAVPVEIQQVLMNLILNAREAMLPGGGKLIISAEKTSDMVCIRVCDTGCGIESGDLNKIFEPFFSTKPDEKSPPGRRASGLGLAFCKKVIKSYNGSITVESKPAGPTKFEITLPNSQ